MTIFSFSLSLLFHYDSNCMRGKWRDTYSTFYSLGTWSTRALSCGYVIDVHVHALLIGAAPDALPPHTHPSSPFSHTRVSITFPEFPFCPTYVFETRSCPAHPCPPHVSPSRKGMSPHIPNKINATPPVFNYYTLFFTGIPNLAKGPMQVQYITSRRICTCQVKSHFVKGPMQVQFVTIRQDVRWEAVP